MSIKYKKLLTIDDLVKFCRENSFCKFNAQDEGYRLTVQVPAKFDIDEADDDHRGMLKLKIKVFHTGLNRNGSYVSEEAAKNAMPTLKNRPLLGAIHQLDSGEWDFESHNMIVVQNENGEDEVEYIERQIGSFSEQDPFFEYDEENDKTFVCAYAYVAEEYTKAADIIRRKNGTKNSCELTIEELSFNAKENFLSLDKFYVTGSTLLGSRADGREIEEGMKGSRADIFDFSEENNSVFSHDEKLIEILEKISNKIDNLSNLTIYENSQKGGNLVSKFEELLEKYGKQADDIDFEYESMTDEELEAKFAELFGDKNTEGEGEDPDLTSDGEDTSIEEEFDDETETEVEEEVEETSDETDEEIETVVEFSVKYSVSNKDGMIKEYELSLDDITNALYWLVNDTYSESDNGWYSVQVYESHVIMSDWWNGRNYKQSYKREDDNFSLTGDRVEVYSNWLTKDEEAALAELRSNYELAVEKLSSYQAVEEFNNKVSLISSADYSSIADKEDFTSLVESVNNKTDNLTFDELKSKCDELLLSYAKSGSLTFAANDTSKKVITRVVGLPSETKNKKSRYGKLFSTK